MRRTFGRRTAAAIVLAVPLTFLSAAPAQADSTGVAEVSDCSVGQGNAGDPEPTGIVTVKNTDSTTHDYTVDVKFTQGGSTAGWARNQYVTNVDAGLTSDPIQVAATSVSSDIDPQGNIGCEITKAKDDAGRNIDIAGSEGPSTGPDTGEGVAHYTVSRGDTLSGIAQQEYGDASQWKRIYNANRQTIEQAAQDHGLPSSDHGHWIFPGIQLVIPQ
ncbi:LysM peptidoglycan-binding domain-containing protein [Streptomyces sp. NPDC007875]|uniref:LysM peptidoglycan-binding domain-containing protein n=1 Tax=Streptomyces sp. NPDC007875 TaxID=3364783 RepID=UPI0036C64ABB